MPNIYINVKIRSHYILDPITRAVQLGLSFPEPLRLPGALAPVASAFAEGRPGEFLLSGPAPARRAALDHLAGRALGAGGRVLYLFPEIAATVELAARFKKVYGRTAVVFHRRMTEKQREEAWRILKSGRAALVAGTRSALFVEPGPLRLVVVDDEQEDHFAFDHTTSG